MSLHDDEREWLETDGRGGFASGTVSGIRTRRYHGLLLTATSPPTGRMMLVNGMDVWVVRGARREALSSQRYDGDVLSPDGIDRLAGFTHLPWPCWTYRLSDGLQIRQEIFVVRRTGATVITWTVDRDAPDCEIEVRLFCSGRDYHATHHENDAFAFGAKTRGETVVFEPYDGVPAIVAASTGVYEARPDWYRRFLYAAERERGLDCLEDLATPGVFRLRAGPGAAALVLGGDEATLEPGPNDGLATRVGRWRQEEQERRARFATPLALAADAYLVRRGKGATIVAGYPWFTDWGRDTFIALRGLFVATGRLREARDILFEWAGTVSEGMLPNRFPDQGEAPEFNSVDASLWFVIAVGDLERKARRVEPGMVNDASWCQVRRAVDAILSGYAAGTRFGIKADADGLLMAGVPGSQLTWMDARIGDWTVTPRVGKPVEVQALWLNALGEAARWSARWEPWLQRGLEAFRSRFWNEARGCLFDVVDVNHEPGQMDDTCRPNQVFALGGLPLALLDGDRARCALEVIERDLLTPIGLRSLAPSEPGYARHYVGDGRARDAAYHQGTAWPWLMAAFVDAWLRVKGNSEKTRAEARCRFLAPLLDHLADAGLGHVSEIADADAPFTPRGCPFQAWSLGELIRLEQTVAVEPAVAEVAQPYRM